MTLLHAAPTTRLSGTDLLSALVVVVAWGLNFVAMKVGLRTFTPFQLGAVRFLLAFLPLALWVRPPAVPWRFVAGYGLLQGVGQFGFLFAALQVGMTASLASVLMQTQVFFTAVLGVVLLRERISRTLAIGMALAAAGLGCFAANVVGATGAAAAAVTALGLVLNLGAATMWAGSNILVRRLQSQGRRYEPLALVVWGSAFAFAGFLILTLAFDGWSAQGAWTEGGTGAWLSALYLGWVATVVAYSLWTRLLQRHSAGRVGPFSLGVPLVGLGAGVAALSERVTPLQAAGAVLVFSALAVVVLAPRWSGRGRD